MTLTQQIITIGAAIAGTLITRFLPFIVFPANRKPPAFVSYLGSVLPAAAMGLLVVYSLRSVDLFSGTHGIPEAIALISVLALHLWRRNMLISIAGGTLLYMVLIQVVF